MNSTTHYENANFLRELAESLPRIFPEGSTDKSALLQRLANEELARGGIRRTDPSESCRCPRR